MSEAYIIDGYVDEPACFGVPPYISPYIRTIAGVLAEHNFTVKYLTIDRLRSDPALLNFVQKSKLAVLVAGITVPGKYLGGTPATLTEIQQIGFSLSFPETFICGPIQFGYSPQGGKKAVKSVFSGFDHILAGDPCSALENVLQGGDSETVQKSAYDYAQSDRWSVKGSEIIKQHPFYPYVMCELETARGCSRHYAGGCSFCTEPLYGPPVFREISGIADETDALYKNGARHFRLGRQPDLLTYSVSGCEFPKPNPDRLRALFSAIRKSAPEIKTLHIDNINPGTIAHHKEAATEALKVIVEGHTPGDVAALGMETADPKVVRANNLKAFPEEVLEAIRIINLVGAKRTNSVPELLPGLNFISGLSGETKETFRLNRDFLKTVYTEGLLVRRVNIRQLMPFEGTPAYEDNTLTLHADEFRSFKEFVRKDFDHKMLKKVFPAGTVLSGVIIEKSGNISFGRQMGSYPILVGIPLKLSERTVTDAVVTDFGMRSVTALPYPIKINGLPLKSVMQIPGIGKKSAAKIVAKRPFSSVKEFEAVAGKNQFFKNFSFTSP